MSAANAVALVATIGSYLVYSRLLTPADFGAYAGALAIAKLGSTLLDGGIKVSLIQKGDDLGPRTYRGAFLVCCALAAMGTGLLGAVLAGLVLTDTLTLDIAAFFALYAAAYFATYPLLVIPLANLERGLKFGPIAQAEGVTVSIEYALPALLWLVEPGFWSFVVSAWLARTLRAGMLLATAGDTAWLTRLHAPDWTGMRALLGAGLYFQLASLASMLRDSLHLLLVGPLFGRDWAGMYAWALQLCGAASQVFVQTASRVSLPWLLVAKGNEARWQSTLAQITWLAAFTSPPLVFLLHVAPPINHALFKDQWTAALALLPFLICRMLPGLATTPLGALVLAQQGMRSYFVANTTWSAAELAVAAACIFIFGVTGLAWSYSFMAWAGVLLFATRLRGASGVPEVLRVVLLRPSVWLALVLAALYNLLPGSAAAALSTAFLYSAAACLLCLATEPCTRQFLSERLRRGLR